MRGQKASGSGVERSPCMREFGVRSLKQVVTAWQQMQVPGVLGDDHHKYSRSGTLKKRHWSMVMSAEDGSDFEDLQR